MDRPEIARSIFLVGPTASGKSAAGIVVAEAAGAEIISLDSMQLWRGMDIGTAKPSAAERARVPHHLIDVLDPSESYSVGRYVEAASRSAADILARGRLPLFVGGTALYLKALTAGFFEGPPADWALRRRLREAAAAQGPEHLHRRLREIDPAAADRIHPNDLRRIIRAIEVYEKTGTPISCLQRQWTDARPDDSPPIIGLDRDRADLYERIDRRVDQMMAEGLPDEVRRLLERPAGPPAGPGLEASQALGYKELIAHLRGELGLAEAVELIKRNSRRFAKRQLTWFRAFPQMIWVRVEREDPPEAVAGKVLEALRGRPGAC